MKKCTGEPKIWGEADFAEDFFTSSPSANLAGKKEGQGNLPRKGALPLVLRAFFRLEQNMYQAIMENGNTKSKSTGTSPPARLFGAIGGIVSGLILLLTGLILSAVSYFDRISFHGFEVILIVAAFVFLAIGSHFLDLIEKDKKSKRIEYCRKHGLTDKECR